MGGVGRPIQVVSLLLALLLSGNLSGKTWVALSPENSIQSIIDSASPGDTIQIMPGHYRQGNIVIRKAITLIGVDFPVLDGEEKFEILTIAADDVSIIGLKFINTGVASISDISAISAIESRRLTILNNRFENTFFGIHLASTSSSVISGNVLHSNKASEHQIANGIHAWKCDSLKIRGNDVSGHRDGIYFEFVTNSVIDGNLSHDNMRYGLHFMFSHNDQYHNNTFRNNGAGVAVMYTHSVTMTGNKFEDNWGAASYGLLLKDIRDSFVDDNQFSRNTIAVYMEGSSRCSFKATHFPKMAGPSRYRPTATKTCFRETAFFQIHLTSQQMVRWC
jgi:nitrous oxidase accessory protein